MAPIRGLINPFQFFNMLFATIEIFFLLNVLDQKIVCSGSRCHFQEYDGIEFVALLMIIDPIVMLIGIILAQPRLLQICKVYNLVEKTLLLCSIFLLSIFTSGLLIENISNQILTEKDRITMALFYALLSSAVLIITLYTIFRNWMINGAIKSVEYDNEMKNQGQAFLSANSGKSFV
ncbi:uncharacterized protein LOC129779580 [Toxorhynchites rutilus septentrionalis]|uniref:uncharacterized protein LOC129779580 n=1 Tax=Toxorhynchites rutilus septentrionalis TaxID=329112 RepID=UPI0024786D7B|nr:uncharacterized protein LOC129779580 [Toxorhynchites rutilus septentrionalis]